jgi:gliding motility-associatede transport system auxiliary component
MTPLSRRLYAITAIVLAAIIFVALNIAADASLNTERLDLTQNGQFTLSQGTRNIIAKLKEPITLKFYYTKKLGADYAQVNAYANRVRDLLQEYAALSDGKIILEEIDPEPYTDAEDQATAAGLTGAPTDSGDYVYFGLVGTNTIDGQKTIPFFAQEREGYLEYDITSLIYKLSNPKKPVIGVLSSLPLATGAGGMAAMLQGRSQPYGIYQELTQSYTTRSIDQTFASIPRDIDVLMIVDPPPLSQAQLFAIDQFVLKGGHALVFVDPYSELAQASAGSMGEQGGAISSNLGLLKSWGVDYNPDKVIGDRLLAQRVQMGGDPRNPVASYPIWLHLTSADFNGKDQVTANLQVLNLASVGALSPIKGATTTFTPLVSSSDRAGLLDADQVRMSVARPADLMGEIKATGKPFAIAARISGLAKTAFPHGAATVAKSVHQRMSGHIDVIVMADSDIFDDRFWVHVANLYGSQVAQPFADNAAFVLNAVENLTGSDDLISLRTRATNDRPFTVVKQLQAQAQAQFAQQAEALQARLTDTEDRLHALEQGGSTNGKPVDSTALTPEQKAAIERFKRDLIETRTQLRDVQHNLRKDIDTLGAFLAFVNIALVPILVALFAILRAILRRRRRARAIAL